MNPFDLKKKTLEVRERQVGLGFFFFLVGWLVFCPYQDSSILQTGILVAVLSLKNFLANDDCLALGKATLYNSEKETSQEAMEPVGIQSKNQKCFGE